jgi:transcriptional regulator GlxA family with amidase domain
VNFLDTTTPVDRGSSTRYRCVYQTIQFLRDHLGRKLTEEELAVSAGITREHFGRLFKSETGEAPMSFLRRLRYEEARVILESEEHLGLSIKQVAARVGIHDASHFVREFERRFGLSPERFREGRIRRTRYITFSQ